ncbi:site-specific integrase [Marinobacter sp.]|uniref:site-specific integrase n=1 Tax=Marinobacter sp. TaxID=50741 RepID=UPI003A8FF92E
MDIQLYNAPRETVVADADHMRRVVSLYLNGMAPSSAETIRYALRQAIEGLGMNAIDVELETFPWNQLTATHLSQLIALWRKDREPATIRLYVYAVRGVIRQCFISQLMPADQYQLVKEVKLPRGANKRGRGRSVEDEEQDAILRNCLDEDSTAGIRDAAIFALFFASGMRRAELAGLDDGDIDYARAEARVRAKGNNVLVKHIQAWAIPYLQDWRAVRKDSGFTSGPVFTRIVKGGRLTGNRLTGRGILGIMEVRCNKAGLDQVVRPHDGRRTMGTAMLKEHGELVAQKVLGHAQLDTTRIYDMRSDDEIKQHFSKAAGPRSKRSDS